MNFALILLLLCVRCVSRAEFPLSIIVAQSRFVHAPHKDADAGGTHFEPKLVEVFNEKLDELEAVLSRFPD